MMYTMMLVGAITLIGLFLGMILFLEIGHRIRIRSVSKEAEKLIGGLGVVEGALFGLMGLVVAFTSLGLPHGLMNGGTSSWRKPMTSAPRTSGSTSSPR